MEVRLRVWECGASLRALAAAGEAIARVGVDRNGFRMRWKSVAREKVWSGVCIAVLVVVR
jgi:hypothetical protein